jgi:hypothetical protein
MYSLRYDFSSEEELETLLVEAWLRFEVLAISTPKLVIAWNECGGFIELRFSDFASRSSFLTVNRSARSDTAEPRSLVRHREGFVAPRASHIVRGLVITRRAADAVVVGYWLKAQAQRGNRRESYWIDIAEGARLLRGIGLGQASELAGGFAETMAAIGRRHPPSGCRIPPKPSRQPQSLLS